MFSTATEKRPWVSTDLAKTSRTILLREDCSKLEKWNRYSFRKLSGTSWIELPHNEQRKSNPQCNILLPEQFNNVRFSSSAPQIFRTDSE